ncbi:MAG TPA: hypothetical protein VN495_01065 [Candidatus Paceibacterota bacterium]|nr:hypothetical protein [Candidatus Paceibacterota bacterium]
MEEFAREHNRRAELDKVATEGQLIKGDLPGTDTYDDGLNANGELVMPGSTSTGSGGTYMEDRGPEDRTNRHEGESIESVMRQKGLRVIEGNKEDMYSGEDAAAKWLRENDPNWRGGKEAA